MQEEKKLTPMMEQWHQCKEGAKGALLFFRMGDFYEAFHEDAVTLAKELELTLTKRQEIPMSGVPWHTAETYIDRLVSKGFKVAIAEQMEDPKAAKGIVKRAVVRIVTPGTHVGSSLLPEKNNQYILSIAQVGSFFGLALCDLTTGEFKVQEMEEEKELFNELYRARPKEILVSTKFKEKYSKWLAPFYVSVQEEWQFEHKLAYSFLTDHFKVHSLDGFGLKGKVAPINAAGALLCYLKQELALSLTPLHTLTLCNSSSTLSIDMTTERHLELNALLKVLDETLTPMGARLLASWLRKPLLDPEEICKRQDAIEALFGARDLRLFLKEIRDLQRLMVKISTRFANPRDYVIFRLSLEQIAPLKERLLTLSSPLLRHLVEDLFDVSPLITTLSEALVDEPPLRLNEGAIFRDGYNKELDELRAISKDGKQWLAAFGARLREETGIKTLKITYNKIFGYTIEVSRGAAHAMPSHFEKRQTLANAERFTCPPLKEYEHKVLNAEEDKNILEAALFEKLQAYVCTFSDKIFATAAAVGAIDALFSLATVAKARGYSRPLVDESLTLEIKGGRHPVVESYLSKEYFIPNDTLLNGVDEQMMLITGPNMAGKSTYIRQVALLVIMAQMGSFIPAQSAHIGAVDKLFTRIGANDDLSRGQSTFMVEMSETANIIHNVTNRSLVILDEIGRGTSTYDGLSIAWAVAEYLLSTEKKKAKTLFATHYCELTALETALKGAKNYHATVSEIKDEIVFLHKIERGIADKSYGIHVARLAGLPLTLIARAQDILNHLEQKGSRKESMQKLGNEKTTRKPLNEQLSLF